MRVTIDGADLWFDVAGQGLVPDGASMRQKPTLIVLHGGPGFDHTGFKPVFDPLTEICQIVYLDHRGNGRSGGRDSKQWTLARWGDDVRALCDTLGIEQPIVLGQSFGGMVAQSYAVRHPGHAGKLIFSSTAARWDLEYSLSWFERLGGLEARAISERFWTRMTDEDRTEYMTKVMPLYNPRAKTDPFLRSRSTMRPEVLRHFGGPGGEMLTMDFRAGLASVTCPTLVLGGALDPITPVDRSREIAASLVNAPAELVLLDNCGHGVWRDDPDQAIAILSRFILA